MIVMSERERKQAESKLRAIISFHIVESVKKGGKKILIKREMLALIKQSQCENADECQGHKEKSSFYSRCCFKQVC